MNLTELTNNTLHITFSLQQLSRVKTLTELFYCSLIKLGKSLSASVKVMLSNMALCNATEEHFLGVLYEKRWCVLCFMYYETHVQSVRCE